MRVLLISLWKPRRGGIVTHVENLMKNSKNDFAVLTYERYINLPLLRALSFVVHGFFKGSRMGYDLIHAHYALPQGLLGVVLKKLRGKPLVVTLHGSDITLLTKNLLTRQLVKFALRNSNKVIAVSEFLREEALKLGVEEEKVKVIRGGVTLQRGPEDKLDISGRLVTFIGSLVEQKGVDVLIEAFQQVKERVPEVKLAIVGEGKERERLEALAKGVQDIYFLGYRRDLTGVLEKSEVLILPSREEGFGLVLLEAMAAGVPVVATRVGGIIEIVEDGYSGILVEKEDSRGLAEGIVRVLENGELRDALSRHGREVVKKFSWKRMGSEVDKIYDEIVRP
jgi:N-acetyl-alpha-D-glucosaminyl L-malate synthase BshA